MLPIRTILVLIFLAQHVFGACPWLCLCYLKETPIKVDCSGVGFSKFPGEIDSRVQQVDLKDNKIESIRNLNTYTELEYLDLSDNKINSISSTAFKKLTKLKYLDLSNNSFTDWSQIKARSLLASTTRLTTLKLSHNSLKIFTAIEGNLFIESSSLEELHLKSCEIKSFDGNSLKNFTKLKYLDLSHNPIRWLNNLYSKTLTYLDVSHCLLDSINPYALINLPGITTLKLSGNSEFDMNIGNLTSGSLQSFEAAHCSLTSPGLAGLPNVTYANLRGNKIEKLNERAFSRNRVLVELDLSLNDIKEIHPFAFVAARQLAFVNLSSNSLKYNIPWNSFSSNINLKALDLSRNQLESVGNLSILALEYLDLSQCSIKDIKKDSLTGLPWLQHLNLSNNPLKNIPNDIQSWSLRNIDFSYCRLSVVTNETFRRFPEIGTINLTGNRFTKPFKTYMFEFNDRLESLKLGDNPWICNCSSRDFKSFWDFLKSYPVKVKSYEEKDVKCMSPDTLAGQSWISACYLEWYPVIELETSNFGIPHYGSVLIVIVIVIAGIFAVIGAIKHGIKQRIKHEEEEMQREMVEALQIQARIVHQRRQTFPLLEVEDTELRTPRPPVRARTESELTQPPTYEEAIQMMASSREDVVSSENVAGVSGQRQAHSDDDDDDDENGQSYSIGSELSDSDSDEEQIRINRKKQSHNSL